MILLNENTVTCLLLYTAHAPLSLWVKATLTAVFFIINLLPSLVLSWFGPYFRLFGRHPNLSSFHTFGCACYPHLGAYTTDSKECGFVGYSLQ